MKNPNTNNIIGGELATVARLTSSDLGWVDPRPMLRSEVGPSLGHHVCTVLFMCARPKVSRLAAKRNVTGVADTGLIFGDAPMGKKVHNSMGEHTLTSKPKLASGGCSILSTRDGCPLPDSAPRLRVQDCSSKQVFEGSVPFAGTVLHGRLQSRLTVTGQGVDAPLAHLLYTFHPHLGSRF